MNDPYILADISRSPPEAIEQTLERGDVAYFERCPIELPSAQDLEFLRSGLPGELKTKNLSYHPESDSVPRFEASTEVRQRVEGILRAHGERVSAFLHETVPGFVPNWQLGTTSFRPIEEQGRNLKPRSSNELVHFDAGAYGATNGARILRFFANVHPTRDRVWGTKGTFESVMSRHQELWAAARGGKPRVPVRKGPLDKAYSGLIRSIGALYPLVRVIDSSPYDRSMRRIHNFMKEDPAFRDGREGYREIHFPPMSAWMVFTDSISHSVLTGQYAFVTTAIVPLANCRNPERSPMGILGAGASC
jgi:hypothetical protein